MNQIQKLTQSIRNCAECELDYGTLRTLKMIDDESIRMEKAVVVKPTLSEGADGGLKSCPYCGGSNLTEFNGRIECEGCGAHGPDEQSGVGWNDRAFA